MILKKKADTMSENRPDKRSGIASLFEKGQLRAGFVNFLYVVAGLEVLIVAIVLIASVGIAREPFPWKAYFFIAFIVPVVMTFLVGIIMMSFNHFFFGRRADLETESDRSAPRETAPSHLPRLKALVDLLGKVPIMLTLIAIILASLALYKLDDAIVFIIQTSEQMIHYLLIAMGILLVVGIVFALTWMVMNYNLRKKRMAYQENFRQAAMERMGVLIGEDQMPLDNDGRMRISSPPSNRELPDRRRPVMLQSGDRKEG